MKKPIILLACILFSACETPRSDTAQTPVAQPPSRVSGLRAPHERVDNVIRKEDTILLVSFFNTGRLDIAQHASLNDEGVLVHSRRVDNWSMHGAPTSLTPQKLESLRTKLATLPETAAHKKDEHAFFVSWQRDGEWITRNYDLTQLPADVQQLFPDLGIQQDWLSTSEK